MNITNELSKKDEKNVCIGMGKRKLKLQQLQFIYFQTLYNLQQFMENKIVYNCFFLTNVIANKISKKT